MDAGIFWEELDEEGDYKGIGWFFLAPTEGGEGSEYVVQQGPSSIFVVELSFHNFCLHCLLILQRRKRGGQ